MYSETSTAVNQDTKVSELATIIVSSYYLLAIRSRHILEEGEKNFHYGEHNVQGSAADQAAFFKLVTLEDAEGDKLLLFSYPIRHQFTLFCDALEL